MWLSEDVSILIRKAERGRGRGRGSARRNENESCGFWVGEEDDGPTSEVAAWPCPGRACEGLAGARRRTLRPVSDVREELRFGRVLQGADFGYGFSGVKRIWRLGDVG